MIKPVDQGKLDVGDNVCLLNRGEGIHNTEVLRDLLHSNKKRLWGQMLPYTVTEL